jgi:hypothetical protein
MSIPLTVAGDSTYLNAAFRSDYKAFEFDGSSNGGVTLVADVAEVVRKIVWVSYEAVWHSRFVSSRSRLFHQTLERKTW